MGRGRVQGRDVFFLGQKSEPAIREDLQVGRNLQDTLNTNYNCCVSMAANTIGVKKNNIIVDMGIINTVMFNPVLVWRNELYETEEGCNNIIKATQYLEELDYEYKRRIYRPR